LIELSIIPWICAGVGAGVVVVGGGADAVVRFRTALSIMVWICGAVTGGGAAVGSAFTLCAASQSPAPCSRSATSPPWAHSAKIGSASP
jgi:hypothetical protein